MIRIFNIKLNKEILFDDSQAKESVIHKDYYDDNPHLLIELKGFNFPDHLSKCENCKAFVKDLGTRSQDWYIEYDDKVRRLNLYHIGSKYKDNQMSYINSYFFLGSKLKLNLDTDTLETLQEELSNNEKIENYERCGEIRDKIIARNTDERY